MLWVIWLFVYIKNVFHSCDKLRIFFGRNTPVFIEMRMKIIVPQDSPYCRYANRLFKDYFLYQPDYMEREMLVAKTLKGRGYKFIFMEDLV